MAKKKRKRTKPAPKALSTAQKRRFMTHLIAAEDGLKTLNATVKSLRAAAKVSTFVPAAPAAARKRRRKRG